MSKTLVIAGTLEQAAYWATRLGLTNWRYVTRPEDILGLKEPDVYLVGTYLESPLNDRGARDYLFMIGAKLHYQHELSGD